MAPPIAPEAQLYAHLHFVTRIWAFFALLFGMAMPAYSQNDVVNATGVEAPFNDDTEYADAEKTAWVLRGQISAKLRMSMFDKSHPKFLPAGILDHTITDETIKTSLGIACPTQEENELISYIRTRAKIVFATAVYSKLNANKVMRWFKAQNLDDSDLPFAPQSDPQLRCWLDEFCEDQWKFIAPIFSTAKDSHDLEEGHILPFISRSAKVQSGSFGDVYRYTIHKDHFSPVSKFVIAKTLLMTDHY
jgi:hypothetical protein